MSAKDYFKHEALSNSGIKEILRSPAHYHHWFHNPKDDTPALRMGRALHQKILEPHRNDDVIVFSQTKTFNSKAGEAFLAQYGDSHICLTVDENIMVCNMVASLHREVGIMRLIESCRREVEIYSLMETSHGPIATKVMADALSERLILDLKTTDKSADEFEWEARRWKYDIQAAWYTDRAEAWDGRPREFHFIVIEKNPPYGILMYEAKDTMIERGREKCREAAETYGRCKALNLWPAYDTRVIRSLN